MSIYQIVYFANIVIAGWVGLISLLASHKAPSLVFQNAFAESEVVKITGAFWVSIALFSILGLFQPEKFTFVFLIQLSYKFLWLIFGALPKLISKQFQQIPIGMTICFLLYVLFLPFIIPFKNYL